MVAILCGNTQGGSTKRIYTHTKHAPSSTEFVRNKTTDEDTLGSQSVVASVLQSLTCGKANVVQRVEQRQPRRLQCIFAGCSVEDTELPGKRVHGLGGGESLVVEAIIERGGGNEKTAKSETCVEAAKLLDDSHCVVVERRRCEEGKRMVSQLASVEIYMPVYDVDIWTSMPRSPPQQGLNLGCIVGEGAPIKMCC